MTHYHNRQQHDIQIKLNASSSLSGTFTQINTNLSFKDIICVFTILNLTEEKCWLWIKNFFSKIYCSLLVSNTEFTGLIKWCFIIWPMKSVKQSNQYKYFHKMLKSLSRHVLVVIKSVCHRLWVTFKNLSALWIFVWTQLKSLGSTFL